MTELVYALISKGQIKEIVEVGNVRNILMSYWFLKTNPLEVLNYAGKLDINIFILDSGAYSAWKNKKTISLFDYIDFIKKYHQHFTHIVCLDVIDNPIYSEVNHLIMLRELQNYNLEIIPVFHSGEPFAVLDYMIERGYKYIGISPNNNWREADKREWLNRVFSRYDFEKLGIKTHAFGYQSISGLAQFPMTTADSTTWVVGEMYGEIIDIGGRVRYSDWVKDDFNHVDNIFGGPSDFILEICKKVGIVPDDLRNDWKARDKFNIKALQIIAQKKSMHQVSYHDDMLGDECYVSDFSEKSISDLYETAKSLGVNYKGHPQVKYDDSFRTRGKSKGEQGEFLF